MKSYTIEFSKNGNTITIESFHAMNKKEALKKASMYKRLGFKSDFPKVEGRIKLEIIK